MTDRHPEDQEEEVADGLDAVETPPATATSSEDVGENPHVEERRASFAEQVAPEVEKMKRKKELREQVLSDFSVTMIVSMFLVQSSLTKETLAMFDCVEVENGKMHINEALEVNCNEEPYSTWAKSAGTFSMVTYVLGIPLSAFLLLFRNRKRFHDHQILARYGFLLNGYNVATSWFWEIVIMGRKILTAIVAIFFARYGPIIQCQLAILITLICIAMHIKFHPYEFMALHNLELYGLVASFFTFYFGMYFLDQNLSSDVRLSFAVIIIILNSAFVLYFLYKMYYNMKSTVMRVLINFNWREDSADEPICCSPG